MDVDVNHGVYVNGERQQFEQRSVSPMKSHIVLPVLGVKFASKPRAMTQNTTEQVMNAEHIPVLEFDDAFATDTPGDPNRKISMMVTTDSIHGLMFAVVARRTIDRTIM